MCPPSYWLLSVCVSRLISVWWTSFREQRHCHCCIQELIRSHDLSAISRVSKYQAGQILCHFYSLIYGHYYEKELHFQVSSVKPLKGISVLFEVWSKVASKPGIHEQNSIWFCYLSLFSQIYSCWFIVSYWFQKGQFL